MSNIIRAEANVDWQCNISGGHIQFAEPTNNKDTEQHAQ